MFTLFDSPRENKDLSADTIENSTIPATQPFVTISSTGDSS